MEYIGSQYEILIMTTDHISNFNLVSIILIIFMSQGFERGWMPHKRETHMVCNLPFPKFIILKRDISGEKKPLPVAW